MNIPRLSSSSLRVSNWLQRAGRLTGVAAVAGCAALLSGTASAQLVQLWTDSVYRGLSFPIPTVGSQGGVRLPSGIRNEVTSIRWFSLPSNVVLRFYTGANFDGREYTVMHGHAATSGVSNVGADYNDDFESMRWFTVDPSQGWVDFHTDADQRGLQFTRYLSRVGLGTIDLRSLGYSDKIDSVTWDLPANRTVMCFDEAPAGGRSLPLIDSGRIDDFTRFAGGLHHDKFSTLHVAAGQFTATYADRNAPLDEVCMLCSHNAHATSAQGWVFWYQQTMTVLEQLDYGARKLQLDVREENGRLYLTHGSYSQSVAQRGGTPPELLGVVIDQIDAWLRAHPKEVIVLEFENYAGTELSRFLRSSRLGPSIFVPTQLHWPSINELVAAGQRVVVFTESDPGTVLSAWDYSVQNGFSSFGSTTARGQSDAIDNKNRSLYHMNHISSWDVPSLWLTSSLSPNTRSALTGLAQALPQTPNAVGIDGIQMADHGGLEACRFINQFLWQGGPRSIGARAFRMQDGCTGMELTAQNRPVLGRPFELAAASGAVVLVGIDDRAFQGTPLPLTLAGFTACALRVNPLMSLGTVRGVASLPVSNVVALVGANLYFQAAEIGGSRVNLSGGVRARLGL